MASKEVPHRIPEILHADLLCGSPLALTADARVASLDTTVDPGDLVIRLTIAGSERPVPQDGAGIHEVREFVIIKNGRVFHVAIGEVKQQSTTTLISWGVQGDQWVGALARGAGSIVRATTSMVEAVVDHVHRMAINVCQWRADDREAYRESIEEPFREDWYDVDNEGRPRTLDEALSLMQHTRSRIRGMDRARSVVEDHVLSQETAEAIRHSIKDRYQQTVQLRRRGWTWAAIAERFGVSPPMMFKMQKQLEKIIQDLMVS